MSLKASAILTLLITLVLVIIISAQRFKTQSFEKITIADAQQPGFALIYIADEKGYFKDEGLEVNYRTFNLGKDALDDVLKGNSDLATVFQTPVVRKINSGDKVSIISTLHKSNKNTALVARISHGISAVSDIRGKKIAVPKGTNPEFFLDLLLKTEGIDESELSILDMPSEDAVKALEGGLIDGVALFNPFLYDAQRKLQADEITFYSDVYTKISTLTGASFINPNNQDKIKKLLKSLVRAEAFARQNRQESIQITQERLNQVDAKTIEDTWDIIDLTVKLDNKLLTIMEREIDFYRENGTFRGPEPSMNEYINTTFLKNISPEKVTLY